MNPKLNPLINAFLCCNNICLPMYKNHYITGKGIFIFSNLACVENTLSAGTNILKNCTYNIINDDNSIDQNNNNNLLE